MKFFFIILLALFGFVGAVRAEEPVNLETYRDASVKKWEKEIARLEALDQSQTHPADSILFVGSSSIRLWSRIATDMLPYHAIQRGFGGSKFSDLAVYADRLITPHQFRAVVIFVGNDIVGKPDDKSPEEVAALFTYFHGKIRAHNPSAAVFYIAVTPTPSRAKAWEKARAANSAIREICQKTENTHFIGTESIFLDAHGNPKPDLFGDDQLHLNSDGYRLWTAAIKSQLDSALNGAK